MGIFHKEKKWKKNYLKLNKEIEIAKKLQDMGYNVRSVNALNNINLNCQFYQ